MHYVVFLDNTSIIELNNIHLKWNGSLILSQAEDFKNNDISKTIWI